MKQTGKNVSPMSNEGRNAYVITHITQALIELLEEKNMEDISISELCDRAGVGRASFYRNFDSKEDVLKKHLQKLWFQWEKDFPDYINTAHFYETILNYFYSHRELNLLLYRHGMSGFLYEMIRWGAKMDDSTNNIERYTKSTVAGFVFGLVDEWMRQGMQETPEQIIALMGYMGQKK